MVRSPRLGSMILLLSPLAQGTKFIVVPKRCHFPWQGASYRRRSTPWPTKRPRLTMILRRSFTIALVCLDSRRSGWISPRITRYMRKNAWPWRCHRNDKALWLSLAQSWARLGEQVASVQHQSGAAAPSLRGAMEALDLVGTRKD